MLLIGGDLTVTVEHAKGLSGMPNKTHPFARVTVLEPFTAAMGRWSGWSGLGWLAKNVDWGVDERLHRQLARQQQTLQCVPKLEYLPSNCLSSQAGQLISWLQHSGLSHLHSVPPAAAGEERSKQTTVAWQSTDPVWDEQLVFRDVCAASGQ